MNDIEQLAQAERDQSLRKLFLKETIEALEIAEINVLLNTDLSGKNEAARDLQRKAALSKDPEYNKSKADKSKAERLLIDAEFCLTVAQKTWQANQSKQEIEVARLNENSSRMTLEAARLSLEAAKIAHALGGQK
jgi:hypothetical protein